MTHSTFTRSTGAESGSETYVFAVLVIVAIYAAVGWYTTLTFVATSLAVQLTAMSAFDAAIYYHFITSQKLGPAVSTPHRHVDLILISSLTF